MAAQVIEVAPGLDIEPLTDVALKHANVQAGILIVERQYGYLEIHGPTEEVRAAGEAVLASLGQSEARAVKPQILASRVVPSIDHQHAFLINRNKVGSMVLPGESLYVLEVQPASYAILAANEAEKAAHVSLVNMQPYGAFGRLWMSGSEAEIDSAAEAAVGLALVIAIYRHQKNIRLQEASKLKG